MRINLTIHMQLYAPHNRCTLRARRGAIVACAEATLCTHKFHVRYATSHSTSMIIRIRCTSRARRGALSPVLINNHNDNNICDFTLHTSDAPFAHIRCAFYTHQMRLLHTSDAPHVRVEALLSPVLDTHNRYAID
jgi:hypothetical protein